jgi:hypothetical protein
MHGWVMRTVDLHPDGKRMALAPAPAQGATAINDKVVVFSISLTTYAASLRCISWRVEHLQPLGMFSRVRLISSLNVSPGRSAIAAWRLTRCRNAYPRLNRRISYRDCRQNDAYITLS